MPFITASYSQILAIILLWWAMQGAVYCQAVVRENINPDTKNQQWISLDIGGGMVIASGTNIIDFTGGSNIIRTLYGDIEIGKRLPIKGQVFDMYGGVQATLYGNE
jgi:hypothetical protein